MTMSQRYSMFFLFVQPLTVKIQRKARECRPNYNIIVIPCLFLLAPPPSVRVNIYICIIVGLGWHQRCKTLPGICILGLALVGNDAVKQSLRELDNQVGVGWQRRCKTITA